MTTCFDVSFPDRQMTQEKEQEGRSERHELTGKWLTSEQKLTVGRREQPCDCHGDIGVGLSLLSVS